MTARTRKTINLDATQSAQLQPFLDEGSPEHATLEALAGRELRSDSEELGALAQLGAREVRRRMLEQGYDDAVDTGAFDDTADWVAGARRRRRVEDD